MTGTGTQTDTRVVDSSVVFAALLDAGGDGEWALQQLAAGPLFGPHLMPFEMANIIRRSVIRGAVEPSEGRSALYELGRLRIELIQFAILDERSWELRENLTAYDATYVAAAELVDGTLVTFNNRVAKAPGIRCRVLTGPLP